MVHNLAKKHTTIAALLVLVLYYFAIYAVFDNLSFPLGKDELHYYPNSITIASEVLSAKKIPRDYAEPSTPLAFIVWGLIAISSPDGIFAGRLINLALSFVISCLVLFRGGRATGRSIRSAAGLLLFPYFIGCSVYLYPDMIATFLVLAGVIFYQKKRPALAGLAFILGISTRQFMIAFPVALLAYEIFRARTGNVRANVANIAWLMLSAASIFVWFWHFGGLAPRSGIEATVFDTGATFAVLPRNGLYLFVSVGIYYLTFELLLFKNYRRYYSILFTKKSLAIAAVLSVLFIMFPPYGNVENDFVTMGYFDKAMTRMFPDIVRMIVYYVFAYLTLLRFSKVNMCSLILFSNALVLMKADAAWEKYAVPVIVALWYLKAADGPDERPEEAPPPS